MATRMIGKWKTFKEMNEAIKELKKKLRKETLIISHGYNDQDKHFFEYE